MKAANADLACVTAQKLSPSVEVLMSGEQEVSGAWVAWVTWVGMKLPKRKVPWAS